MNTKQKLLGMALAAAAALAPAALLADENSPKEGHVLNVAAIKIKYGRFDDYWAFLRTTWRQEMEEAKKAGIIVNYAVYGAQAHNPSEPDLYLVIEYANMAALDGLDEKMEAIDKKIMGSTKASNQAAVDRESMRMVMGEENIRELQFK
jgi:hypothetical protein